MTIRHLLDQDIAVAHMSFEYRCIEHTRREYKYGNISFEIMQKRVSQCEQAMRLAAADWDAAVCAEVMET